jgi:hypothetical protein
MTDNKLTKLIGDIKNAGTLIEAATTRSLKGDVESWDQLIALLGAAQTMIDEHIIGPDHDAFLYNSLCGLGRGRNENAN